MGPGIAMGCNRFRANGGLPKCSQRIKVAESEENALISVRVPYYPVIPFSFLA
jgi:hypothetical protein